MNTVAFPRTVPPVIPALGAFGGSPWRPAPQVPAAYHQPRLAQAQWRPPRLAQAASLAKGADVLFSLLTGVGAMTVGIAAMTVGVGADPKASPPVKPSHTWKWIGGITAALGAFMILINVAKISKFSETLPTDSTASRVPQTTAP